MRENLLRNPAGNAASRRGGNPVNDPTNQSINQQDARQTMNGSQRPYPPRGYPRNDVRTHQGAGRGGMVGQIYSETSHGGDNWQRGSHQHHHQQQQSSRMQAPVTSRGNNNQYGRVQSGSQDARRTVEHRQQNGNGGVEREFGTGGGSERKTVDEDVPVRNTAIRAAPARTAYRKTTKVEDQNQRGTPKRSFFSYLLQKFINGHF